jgi:hypothetical protein
MCLLIEENKMEMNKTARDILSVAQALNSDVVLYNDNVNLETTERKALIFQDIKLIKINIEKLEKALV